ncbi:MAG: serine/threonine-protein kinase, partial [Marinicella sp.]
LLPGERVGRFRVEQVIAQGGMGLVYKGYDELLGRHVAIKTIRPDYAFKPATQQRFIREAQILSKINDSRICQIYDFIDQNDCEFIVLEYIDGKNLNDRETALAQTDQLELFVQLAEALESAHQQGIIHRDLKPDNLMVTGEPSLKILDFGIARSAANTPLIELQKSDSTENKNAQSDLTVAGSIMGTLRYMSPEQVRGEEVTTASDMYSVGVILQETLTGEFAYELNDTNELRNQVAYAHLTNPKNLPHSLQSIISDLTQLEADKRLSANELKQRLKHYIDKPQRQKKNLLVASLFCLVLVATWFWYFRYEEASKTQVFNDYLIEAETLGNQLSQIFTLPIHDITSEIELNKNKAISLVEQIEQDPLFDDPSKAYLQGIAYKNVLQFKEAFYLLEKSWSLGFKNDQVIHELADSAIRLWWNTEFNGFLTSKPLDEAAVFRQKAYDYAQLSKDAGGQVNSIASAYLLWRLQKFDEALDMIDEALESADWQYDGYLLKAGIFTNKIMTLDTGRTAEESYQMGLDAIKAYELAVERARSHPGSYVGVCQMNKRVIREALTNSGFDVDPLFKNGIQACKQALLVLPKDPYVRSVLASIYVTYSEVQLQKGHDISHLLDEAQKWIDEDIAYFPKDSSYLNKAEIHSKKAQINNRKGLDPQPQIELAVEAYKKASELNPNTLSENTIGVLYNLEILAQFQLARGLDVSSTFAEAQSAFKRFYQAEIERYHTQLVVVHMNTAAIYYVYAKYLLLIGEPVNQVVEKGLEILNQHPEIFANESFIYGIKAQLLSALVKQKLNDSDETTEVLELLHRNIDQALDLFPNQNELLLIKANGLFFSQQNDAFLKQPSLITNEEIKLYYQKAIDANPGFAPSYVDFAKYLGYLANNAEASKTRLSIITAAIQQCDFALQINPNLAEAYSFKADLLTLKNSSQEEIDQLRRQAMTLNPLFAK